MTSLTTKLMIAAAALVAASAASAQTLKADIPFAFQASGKAMSAGTYQVVYRGGTSNIVLIRRDNHEAVLATPVGRKQSKAENAKLVFVCARGNCSLSQIWAGNSSDGLEFRTPKLDPREQASVVAIPMRLGADE